MNRIDSFPPVPSVADPFVGQVGHALSKLLAAIDPLPSTLLIALSGGPDSCALLLAARALAAASSTFSLSACHINHGLRGEESDQDEEFCRKLCHHLAVDLSVVNLDGVARSEGKMRDARYAALSSVASRTVGACLATAHTLDDQVETVLFRIFRGSAPGGLMGIPARREINSCLQVVRPLLNIARSDVLAFLARHQFVARQDSSNLSTEYGRNYIRRLVIPQIAERFPSFKKSVERMRQMLEADEALLEELTQKAGKSVLENSDLFALKALSAQALSVQRRLLVEALHQRNLEVTFERINAILELAAAGSGSLSLDEWWDVRAQGGKMLFVFKSDLEDADASRFDEIELKLPGLTFALELGVAVEAEAFDTPVMSMAYPEAFDEEALVDLSRVVPPVVVRMRRPGDVIKPFGMEIDVKLKKYLHTHKTSCPSNPLRSIVIADAQEVLWVPGVGLSQKVKVVGKPSHRLKMLGCK